MLKNLLRGSVCSALILPFAVPYPRLAIAQGFDPNLRSSPSSEQNATFQPDAFRDEVSRATPVIASATLAAPNSSTRINVTITNLSNQSTIGARDIRTVILDCHRAFVRRALTIDQVFAVQAPPGGTATVTTGQDRDDVGPAVLTFTDFNAGESVRFSLDPDTWNNSNFDARRKDMAGCRVAVVFFPAGNLRGQGAMRLLPDGSVQAAITQRRV